MVPPRAASRRIVVLGETTSRLAHGLSQRAGLPAVMGKSLVGFGHAVRIVFLLHGSAAVIGSVQELRGQPLHHRLLAPLTRIADNPAQTQRALSIPVHFDRYLVIRTADAARLHFQSRLDVIDRL